MEKFMHLIFLVVSSGCAAENITVVYGMEGGTVSVNCSYNPWQQLWRKKSWCRQVGQSQCQHVVSARRLWLPFLPSWNGTTSISDDVHAGLLTVTMRQLRKQDAGIYQCQTHHLGEAQSLGKVRVEVLPDVLETQMPEEPQAVQSISSLPPAADFTAFYILAGFLLSKFVVALLTFAIITSRMQRGTEQQGPGLQSLPLTAAPAASGFSPSWGSSAVVGLRAGMS
ncbi:triggering receptor expressed on myeloid cells 2-like isoform X2 [Pogoniulus pusillus]|uniref:triggering receptor expressed on myeloid cells 2-like isoform X2 n=1 Tax=Pogoniulus pusillus TaxID=488313 RepID=UPI0030B951E5